MITRKYYLIQLVEDSGQDYWLRNDCRHFHWNNHGKDKEYKFLSAAITRAKKIRKRLVNQNQILNVVEVTFKPCNPLLPDGFYEPVKRSVATF